MCTFGGNLNLYAMKEKIRQALRICLLFALLLIPIVYAACVAIDLEYSWLKKMAYLWVVFILLLLPALFLKARTYFLVEGVLNFLFFPIDMASLYLNRQSTSVAFLQNILHTNVQEATELMIAMWPMCLVVIVLYATYFITALGVENKHLIPKPIQKTILIGGALAVITGMVVFAFLGHARNKKFSAWELMYYAADTAFMKLYKVFPYNLYLNGLEIAQKYHTQLQWQEQVATFRFGITPTVQDSTALYILVLGETARYDHLGINGYARNTTPLLAKQTNLISYDSTFSQANLTTYSLPLILSRATANNNHVAYMEKSIVGAFQEAGFASGYINKQQPTNIEARILKNCNYPFQYNKTIDIDGNYDQEMVDKLAQFVADTAQFFVLHTLGNHFRYELRYPKEFAVYQPVMGNSFSYSMINESNKDKFVNAYDNAILYFDFVMNKLIEYVDSLNRPAVIVYISDHGESLWDDDRKLSLHGSYEIAKHEFHVPMLIWYSNQYQSKYPDKISHIKQNKAKRLSSDVIFYSMADLAGITELVDSTKSICSPHLQTVDSMWVFDGSGKVNAISLVELAKQ